jgi:hypothetical protein
MRIVLFLLVVWAIALGARSACADPFDEPRYPGIHHERSWPEQPHYLPSYERTQRGYLPSYQYELERREICGSYCDDFSRRRPGPFEK